VLGRDSMAIPDNCHSVCLTPHDVGMKWMGILNTMASTMITLDKLDVAVDEEGGEAIAHCDQVKFGEAPLREATAKLVAAYAKAGKLNLILEQLDNATVDLLAGAAAKERVSRWSGPQQGGPHSPFVPCEEQF
jgi:hypothetical protein